MSSAKRNRLVFNLATASLTLSLLGLLSKGIGFLREIVYANNFGLSAEFDLFLTSAAIIMVINTATIYLCQHYFIPAYNEVKKNSSSLSEENEEAFFSSTFWLFVAYSIAVVVLLALFSKVIIGAYLSSLPAKIQSSGYIIYLLFLITIPFNAGISVIMAYMQANVIFVKPAVSQIVLNTIIVVFVFAFTGVFQIYVLPASFIAGYIVSFFLLFLPLKKKLKFTSDKILRPDFSRASAKVLASLIIIEGLSLSYMLADRYFVGVIPSGGIAALNYASVIFNLPVSLFAIPLITTLFSKFSLTYTENPQNLKSDLERSFNINAFIIVPASCILFFWGDVFLRLFYERGKFTSTDTIITHGALQFYSIGLFFYASYLIVVKLFYSMNNYKNVLVISVAAFFIKILLNFLFVNSMAQDGLALSTSLVYMFLFLSGFFIASNILNSRKEVFYLTGLMYYAFMAISAFIISHILVSVFGTDGIQAKISEIILFMCIYILNSYISGDEGLQQIWKTTAGFVKR